MGWWARLREWWASGAEPNSYRAVALKNIRDIRRDVRDRNGNDREVVRPIEARRLKEEIRACAEQGGKINYKIAVALWQHGKALYDEWITDEDRPTFVPEYWNLVTDEELQTR